MVSRLLTDLMMNFFVFPVAAGGAVECDESFLFGVVFGGASGCWGDTELGLVATMAWLTILRGRPRGAFLSLSLDLDPLDNGNK